MGDSLRHTFRNVTSVFAPSCISHSVLTKRDWQHVKIDDVTLPQALRCWELSTQEDDMALSEIHGMLGDAPSLRKGNKSPKSRNRPGSQRDHPKRNKKRRQRNKIRDRKRKEKKGRRKNKLRASRQAPICKQRLIERCSWPQCNHSCPKLHNPFTGEEMDFIELLKSFGLDMKSVANALGMDMQTLNNMDPNELLNLLTQQAN